MHRSPDLRSDAELMILVERHASLDNLHGKCIRQILALGFPVDSRSIILDNACGFGSLTHTIQDSFHPVARPKVHAVDIDPDALSIMELIGRKKQWTRYEMAVMNARQLKVPDNSFTDSFMSFATSLIKEPEVAAREIYRTLRPGGVAVISSGNRCDRLDGVLQNIGHVERAEPLDEDYKLYCHFAEWISGQKIVDVMKQGGFEQEKIRLETVVMWLHGKERDEYLSMFTDVDTTSGPYEVGGNGTAEQRQRQRRLSLAISELNLEGVPLGIQTAVVVARK